MRWKPALVALVLVAASLVAATPKAGARELPADPVYGGELHLETFAELAPTHGRRMMGLVGAPGTTDLFVSVQEGQV